MSKLNELIAVMRNHYINENEPELVKTLNEALIVAPDNSFLLNFKAEILLRHKQYAEGWKLWEHRETRQNLINSNKEISLWDGSNLNGRTLLVAGEQGIGDHIMYARWLPALSKQNGNIALYLQLPYILDRLMNSVSSIPASSNFSSFKFPAIFPNDVPQQKLTHIDCWIPLASLPLMLGQYEPTPLRPNPLMLGQYEPTPEPYIQAVPEDIQKFRQYTDTDLFKVGLCWQGNPTHPFDAFRSIPFDKLKILTNDNRCVFYSLQKGDSQGLVNLCDYTSDMADVAAAIANLDMVITVDTAIAHLAGAMGKNVWIMLSKPFDWRWGTPENPSNWYGSAEYFWQKTKWHTPDAWNGIIDDVIDQFM